MNINSFVEKNAQNAEIMEGNKTSWNYDFGTDDERSKLLTRVYSLKQTIKTLKSELTEERALWKKEVELAAKLLSPGERLVESEATLDSETDARPVSPFAASHDSSASAPSIRDYEEKLCRYQGALAQAQAEKRLNIRRQIAANTYRKRLNEVEKLCQEELDKVRETAIHLEPLKQIASEWNKHEPILEESSKAERTRTKPSNHIECGGDFLGSKNKETRLREDVDTYEVPVRQIDANLVMDEDASNEIKGKIVLQIGSLPSEVPTICYSAKFD